MTKIIRPDISKLIYITKLTHHHKNDKQSLYIFLDMQFISIESTKTFDLFLIDLLQLLFSPVLTHEGPEKHFLCPLFYESSLAYMYRLFIEMNNRKPIRSFAR